MDRNAGTQSVLRANIFFFDMFCSAKQNKQMAQANENAKANK